MKEWKNKKANKAEEKEVDGKLKKGGGPRVEQEHARLDDIRRHVPSAPEGARQKITEAAVDFALENGLSMNVLTSRTFQFLLDTRAEAGKIDYSVVLALRDHAETIKSGTFANRPDMICFLLERWATVRGIP